MRRDNLDRVVSRIKIVKPWLFFQRCDCCTQDVRHEKMWKYPGRYSDYDYTCMECAPTLRALVAIATTDLGKFTEVEIPILEEKFRMKNQ